MTNLMFTYSKFKVEIIKFVIARHRIVEGFFAINLPYSSTLGRAVAISRKRPCKKFARSIA